ncbi:MAG: hypothetical protein Q4E05_09165, partial [Pseudoclavibacter sp.]|nr:hypothetical protein [Pseudoclavibacter sp.]
AAVWSGGSGGAAAAGTARSDVAPAVTAVSVRGAARCHTASTVSSRVAEAIELVVVIVINLDVDISLGLDVDVNVSVAVDIDVDVSVGFDVDIDVPVAAAIDTGGELLLIGGVGPATHRFVSATRLGIGRVVRRPLPLIDQWDVPVTAFRLDAFEEVLKFRGNRVF